MNLETRKNLVLSRKVLDSKGTSKKLYKLVKELTGRKSKNPLPLEENDNTLADKFADYFMNKMQKIRESLKDFEN